MSKKKAQLLFHFLFHLPISSIQNKTKPRQFSLFFSNSIGNSLHDEDFMNLYRGSVNEFVNVGSRVVEDFFVM
jgi:hypothetical protein